MFAVAVASAALPSLARLHSQGAHEAALSAMRHSVRLTSFVALPCSAALIALAAPTVSVIFGRGAFGFDDIEKTASALAWLSAGVLPIAAIQPVIRIYYAYGDTRAPVIASAINLIVFGATSLLLVPYLSHAAIACATSVAGSVQLAFLLARLRPHVKERGLSGVGMRELAWAVGKHALASAALGVVALLIASQGAWDRGGNDLRNLAVYAVAVLASGGAFALASYALKTDELVQVMRALRGKTRAS
jgi:putative peptidoglycan lipid II flippase